ncbi:MAG: M23 family metallopeptidase [Methylotenera sp.]|nr:M23 family metallopeptidase [Oligoflexia bacterium]
MRKFNPGTSLTLLVSLLLIGCSTVRPAPPEREGLFQYWGKMKTPRYARDARDNHLVARKPASPFGPRHSGETPVLVEISRETRTLTSDWQWPLQEVAVTSNYGQRGSDFHDGVDLKAKVGTSVYAASSGQVLYADSKIRGYGKMVVIKHGGKLSTVYAHNSKLLVRRGEKVKRGQKIAISGNTGKSTGPHLHFEVRDGVLAMDPVALITPRGFNPVARKTPLGRTVATRDR